MAHHFLDGAAPSPADDALAARREAIDAALNRLLCDLALDNDGQASRGTIDPAHLIELVTALQSPLLDAPIARVAAAHDNSEYASALSAFSEAWTRWTV